MKHAKSHLRPTEQEREIMGAALTKCRDIAKELHSRGNPRGIPHHDIKWSWNLTKTAGNIRWRKGEEPTIRISAIIFLHCLREHGQERMLAEMGQTVIHEYAHLMCGRGVHHGPQWKAAMKFAGVQPSVYHYMETIEDIIPLEWKQLVPLAKRVYYLADGQLRYGMVKRYNAKTVTITDESNSGMRWWRIHWHRIEDAINDAQALIALALEDEDLEEDEKEDVEYDEKLSEIGIRLDDPIPFPTPQRPSSRSSRYIVSILQDGCRWKDIGGFQFKENAERYIGLMEDVMAPGPLQELAITDRKSGRMISHSIPPVDGVAPPPHDPFEAPYTIAVMERGDDDKGWVTDVGSFSRLSDATGWVDDHSDKIADYLKFVVTEATDAEVLMYTSEGWVEK